MIEKSCVDDGLGDDTVFSTPKSVTSRDENRSADPQTRVGFFLLHARRRLWGGRDGRCCGADAVIDGYGVVRNARYGAQEQVGSHRRSFGLGPWQEHNSDQRRYRLAYGLWLDCKASRPSSKRLTATRSSSISDADFDPSSAAQVRVRGGGGAPAGTLATGGTITAN